MVAKKRSTAPKRKGNAAPTPGSAHLADFQEIAKISKEIFAATKATEPRRSTSPTLLDKINFVQCRTKQLDALLSILAEVDPDMDVAEDWSNLNWLLRDLFREVHASIEVIIEAARHRGAAEVSHG